MGVVVCAGILGQQEVVRGCFAGGRLAGRLGGANEIDAAST